MTSIPLRFKIIFLIILVIILGGGTTIYHYTSESIKSEQYQELESITRFKVRQIENWRNERLTDALTIQNNPILKKALINLLKNPSSVTERNLFLNWMELLKSRADYSDVNIFTHTNNMLISPDTTISEVNLALTLSFPQKFVPENKYNYFFDLINLNDSAVSVVIAAPIYHEDMLIATILLEADPHKFLYPLIDSWPIASNTKRTIVGRVERDSVLILNDIEYYNIQAFHLGFSIRNQDLPVVKAATGYRGIIEGKDFRNQHVIAYSSTVNSSNWFLISSVNSDEILEPVKSTIFGISTVAGILILSTILLILNLISSEKNKYYEQQVRLEQEKQALNKHYEYLTKNANDIIILIDENGLIVEVNRKGTDVFGYTREEFLGMPFTELRKQDVRKNALQQIFHVEQSGKFLFEAIYQKKDNTTFPAEISVALIYIEGKKFYQAIIRDITERKEAEKKIQYANRLYSVLSHINQSILNISKKDLLFREICSILIEHGKFVFAWIGELDQKNKIITPVANAGYNDGFLDSLIIKFDDKPEGNGPSGMAVKTKSCYAGNNIATTNSFSAWKNEAVKRGYASCISAPVFVNKNVDAVLNVYSSEPDFFSKEEINLFEEISRDISNAIQTLQTRSQKEDAEKKLAESELIYRTLFHNSNDGIFIMDKETIIDCNQKSITMFAQTKDKIVGKTPFHFSPEIQPDGSASIQSGTEKINLALSGTPQRFEWKHRTLTNILFDTEVTLNTFSLNNMTYLMAVIRDISAKKKSESQLAQNNLLRKMILETAGDGFHIIDSTGRILEVNNSFCEMVSYSKSELTQMPISEVYDEWTPSNAASYIRKLMNAESLIFNMNAKRKDGSLILMEVRTNYIKINSDDLLFCSARDITEFKKYQESLELTSDKLNEAEKIAGLGYWEYDPIKNVTTWSDNTYNIFRKDKKIFQPTFESYISSLYPDDKPKLDSLYEEILKTKRGGEIILRHVLDDGSIITIRNIIRTQFENNKLIRLYGVNIDITELAKKEKMLVMMSRSVEQSPVSVVITDKTGIIEYANKSTSRISGYPNKQLIGNTPRIFSSGLHDQAFYKDMWDTVLSGKNWYGQFKNRRKNGEVYWESAVISPIRDETSEISHFVAIKEDITRKKQLEDELIKAKNTAEEMNHLKTTFLANMSHELRTPMIGILGYSELLETEVENLEHREMVSVILKSGKRLNDTLNSILDLSKIEADQQELRITSVNINDTLIESVKLFEIAAADKGLNLKLKLPEKPVFVMMDKYLLIKVFNNLISNAIKYTEKGGLNVFTVVKDNKLTIQFADTGIGIAEEHLELIFDSFRQVSEGFSRNFEGTGLGLSITKKFVDMMGGSISVESELNKGSVFTLTFDLQNNYEIAEPQTRNDETSEPALPTTQHNILLIEDDPVSAKVIRNYIINYYDVDVVVNAEDALTAAKVVNYDAVLLDIGLKGSMNGLDVAKKLRKIKSYKNTPVIAVTAFAMPGDREMILSAGCSHYLAKPFLRKDLLDLLYNVLE